MLHAHARTLGRGNIYSYIKYNKNNKVGNKGTYTNIYE